MSLNPDDPRPPYIQVAQALRAAILTKKFAPGDKLPSRQQLAQTYGVAAMTVQSAIRELRDEGLVVSRQGSGVFVRERTERAVGLRPHMERAFEAEHVSIDFAGFSGETLHGVIQEPLDKIRIGRLTPKSLRVRILAADMSVPVTLPVRAEDRADSPGYRRRMTEVFRRHTLAITDNIEELGRLGLVAEVSTEVRLHRVAPLFKLYLINDADAFFGFYPLREHVLTFDNQAEAVYDLMGKDALLFHHSVDDDDTSTGSQYVEQSRLWFANMWDTIAIPYDQ